MRVVQICDFCLENICNSNKLWDLHHKSYESLRNSVEQSCVFCSSLWQSIVAHYDSPQDLNLPVYRWNIRRLTRTRDTSDMVAVVFRPLGHDQNPSAGEKGGYLSQKSFHFHREENLGYLPDREQLGLRSDSKEAWAQVEKWINECRTNHEPCRRKTHDKTPVPTRLLDISDIDPDPSKLSRGKLRLVVTKERKMDGPYVTLSHKWGTHKFETITAANAELAMKEGFSMNDSRITQNFREAIIVARRLKVNYIWIDSLCILQNNPVDFAKEAPCMHDYYRYALCNIAAAAADEPSDGLFRDKYTDDNHYPPGFARYKSGKENTNFGEASWVVLPVDFWEVQLLSNPLYSRAWVFQERMLASRILHFSHHQIFFECATLVACEALPTGIPGISGIRAATDRHWRERLQYGISTSERPLFGTADLSIEDFWATAVNTYSRCNLTRGSDKIIALSGIETLVKQALFKKIAGTGRFVNQQYRAGLWNEALAEQLAWRVVDCRQENGDGSKRPHDRDFPSWSWASVDGVLEIQDRFARRSRIYSVKSHDGKDIEFEPDRKVQVIDTPDALKTGAKDVKTEGDGNTDAKQDDSVATQTEPEVDYTQAFKRLKILPKEDSFIKIRGHIGRGQISWSFEERKGTMKPLNSPDDVSCETFLDEMPPQRQVDFVPSKDYECQFFVLAYSSSTGSQSQGSRQTQRHDELSEEDSAVGQVILRRDTEPVGPPLYFGIGLIVQEEAPNRFSRRGKFTFHSLLENQLATFAPVDVLHEDEPEQESCLKPQNFFLC